MKHRLHSWEYVLTFTLDNGEETIEQQHVYPVNKDNDLVLARASDSGYVEVSLSCNVPQPDEQGFFITNKEHVLHQNQRWAHLETQGSNKVQWNSVKQITIEEYQGQTHTLKSPFPEKEITLKAS